jgi:hypothetical protein
VNLRTQSALRAARKAATRLVAVCRKGGPLYARSPRAVAQVSRTGKWFLNAIAALGRALSGPAANEARAKS